MGNAFQIPNGIYKIHLSTSKQNVYKAREGVKKGFTDFVTDKGKGDYSLYTITDSATSLTDKLSVELTRTLTDTTTVKLTDKASLNNIKDKEVDKYYYKLEIMSLKKLEIALLTNTIWHISILSRPAIRIVQDQLFII